nr:hypothetical protein [Candidatus Freyarchaeota archaeon]
MRYRGPQNHAGLVLPVSFMVHKLKKEQSIITQPKIEIIGAHLRKFNIVFATPFFSSKAGGIASVHYSLAKYQKREGLNILIFSTNFGRKDAKFPDESYLQIIEFDYLLNIGV